MESYFFNLILIMHVTCFDPHSFTDRPSQPSSVETATKATSIPHGIPTATPPDQQGIALNNHMVL